MLTADRTRLRTRAPLAGHEPPAAQARPASTSPMLPDGVTHLGWASPRSAGR